jgi:acetyl-CoA synthetase
MTRIATALSQAGIDKPFVLVPAAGMPAQALEPLRGIAIAVPETASAMAALDWWTRGAPGAAAEATHAGPALVEVDEAAAKATLAGLGVATPRGVAVGSSAEAVEFASSEPGRYVLKCLRPAFAHKAAVGAVRLGLTSDEVAAAWEDMAEAVEAAAGEPMTQALIEEQVAPGLELIVSVGHDDDYGPYLTIGAGGSAVETEADVVHRLLPVQRDDIEAALAQLRIAGALGHAARSGGSEGVAPADLVDLIETLARVGTERHGITIEINPVIVPLGWGASVAVDCLLIDD